MITDKNLTSMGLASLRTMIDTLIDRILATAPFFSIFTIAVQRSVVAGFGAGAIKG